MGLCFGFWWKHLTTYHLVCPSDTDLGTHSAITAQTRQATVFVKWLCCVWIMRWGLTFWSKMPQNLKIGLWELSGSTSKYHGSLYFAKGAKWGFHLTPFTHGISTSCSLNHKAQTQQKNLGMITPIVYGWVSVQGAAICWAHSYLSWSHQSNSVDNRNP